MCDADGRQVEHGAEPECEPGVARVVASGGVREQHVRPLVQRPHGCLEQLPLAQREQPRGVGGAGGAYDEGDVGR